MRRALGVLVLLTALLIPMLVGCGGSGSGGGTGSAQFTIKWPDASRLIPQAAGSIRIILTHWEETSAARQSVETQVANRVIPRPPAGQTETVVTFSDLPEGHLSVQATAYPTADGTGTPQAVGYTSATIVSGQVATATLTMGTTVQSVVVTPAEYSVPVGGDVVFTAEARDGSGATVLTAPSKWSWSLDNASVATLSPDGATVTVTGAAIGSGTLTATEQESGKAGSALVVVTSSTPRIYGKVTDTSGSPIAGVHVETSNGQQTWDDVTDAQGLYTLAQVPVGQRVVSYSAPGRISSFATALVESDSEIEIDIILQDFAGTLAGPPVIALDVSDVDDIVGQAQVSGTIDNLDCDQAVLIVNGAESLIPVGAGAVVGRSPESLWTAVILQPGANSVYVRAVNGLGTAMSDNLDLSWLPEAPPDLHAPVFRVTLAWDGEGDLDLHVWNPNHLHASYFGMEMIDPRLPGIALGALDTDNVSSYGPENFTCYHHGPIAPGGPPIQGGNPVAGRYPVAVNSYQAPPGRLAMVRVNVVWDPATSSYGHFATYDFGPYTFNGSDQGGGYPVTVNTDSWWRPVDVVVDSTGAVSVAEPDTTQALYAYPEEFGARRALGRPVPPKQ
jgi:uncharacterized protein YfaP (DUF2135 family)